MTFRDIRAGGIFGELAAIDSKPRSASVEATSHCTVAAMSAELFWEMLRSEQAVMTDVLKFLSERVRDLSERVIDLQTKDVRRRILGRVAAHGAAIGDGVRQRRTLPGADGR